MSTTSNEKLSSSQKLHETVANPLSEVGANLKDQRAHERARHQTKERREHAQLKERKEKAAAARVTGLKERTGSRTGKKANVESWDGDEPEYTLAASDHPATVAPVLVPGNGNKSGFPKIALADLVTFKTKKPSKHGMYCNILSPCQYADFRMLHKMPTSRSSHPSVRSLLLMTLESTLRSTSLGNSSLSRPNHRRGRVCRMLRPLL